MVITKGTSCPIWTGVVWVVVLRSARSKVPVLKPASNVWLVLPSGPVVTEMVGKPFAGPDVATVASESFKSLFAPSPVLATVS